MTRCCRIKTTLPLAAALSALIPLFGSPSYSLAAERTKEVVTKDFIVVPNETTFGAMTDLCTRKSLDRLRELASRFHEKTPEIAQPLIQCAGMEDEVLFWVGFFHRASGETSSAIKASFPFAKDTTLSRARNLARLGNYDNAESTYRGFIAQPTLSENLAARIELGYLLLLKADFAGAESVFLNLTRDDLTTIETELVRRGLEMARVRSARPIGTEDNHLALSLFNLSNDDEVEISGAQLQWKAKMMEVDIRSGDIVFDPGYLSANSELYNRTKYKERFLYAVLGKRFQFNSGTGIAAFAGYSPIGGHDQFVTKFALRQDFKNNISLYNNLDRSPYGLEEFATSEQIGLKTTKTAITAGASFGGIFPTHRNFALEAKLVQIENTKEGDQLVSALIRTDIPIFNGNNLADYLHATLRCEALSGSNEKAQFYSPKGALTFGVGAEFSHRFTLWQPLTVSLPAEFLSIARDASKRPKNPFAESTDPEVRRLKGDGKSSKERQYIDGEAGFEATPRIDMEIGADFAVFFNLHTVTFRDSITTNTTWQQTDFSVGVNWNYGQNRVPRP